MGIDCDTLEATRKAMKEKLAGVVPDFELHLKAELVYEINRLKREKAALILGHNYMEPALFHTVPDVVGDSLELARAAASTSADPIIFCGVRFMAETAKILNPARTVLLPAKKAGCSLAEAITPEDIRALRMREHRHIGELFPRVGDIFNRELLMDFTATAPADYRPRL